MKIIKTLVASLLLGALLISCAPSMGVPVDSEYILTTDLRDGKFVYVGVNEDIRGVVNPTLQAQPGERILITLINSGDGSHDIVFPDLNVKSNTVDKKGDTTSVTFTVPDKEVSLTYQDSTHARLGMSGVLLVGSAVSLVKSTGVTVEYTLETGLADGKMIFTGKGGDIDGKINPDLKANVGDIVKVTLISGEGAQHNILFEGANAKSDDVVGPGNSVTLEFTPSQDGTFAYYCNIPGHRQAGMEGKFIVGSGTATASASAGNTYAASGTIENVSVSAGQADANAVDITRDPTDIPAPIGDRGPESVRVDLETVELSGQLADGTTFTYWTFNGKVPGPFIRVRVGDTIELHLKNMPDSTMPHSIDLHAVTGPGGGAVATQTQPGGETMFTFQALKPGLFVYHCATPMVPQHISNGMYGMILVEPEGGLPPVDREFYVMQGELYTAQPFGTTGSLTEDTIKLLDESPEYFVFNGASLALASDTHALRANVGETVRIFFGVGGPNFTSSFHVIGEIFDRVYDQASLTTDPMTDVQTTLVPPGGATMVEFKLEVPGRYILVDHALSRLQRGLAGYLYAEGDPNPEVFNAEVNSGD
ncbi:MAG: nitrite reductase, copper-containing [Anaerolineales bacterium]|nr:nitrite reductase, copper-containing [Anaerolineales bacterium]